MEERSNPGGLVVNGSTTQEPCPAVQSHLSGLRKPVAVILASPRRGTSAATTAAAPCLSRSALVSVIPGESKVMPSKVNTSSPAHSPCHMANAAMTS